jgi:hypothetical protein
MNIEFVNENTVKITASLEWFAARPTSDLKKIQKKDYFINEFVKQYPAYKVTQALGPDKISNFKEEAASKGEWTLTVAKAEKASRPRRKAPAEAIKTELPKPPALKKKTLKKGV